MDLVGTRRQSCPRGAWSHPGRRSWLGPAAWGVAASVALVALYLGIITLAQDWAHARQQFMVDRWFVGAISAGFGLQVGLFVYLRSLHARARAGAIAASTGTSTAAMLACCAHHAADALPLIGLSGAAVFLNDWKGPILWTGMAMNAAGISYLLWKIRQQRTHIARAKG